MIYPDVDPEIWSRRHNIKIKERKCERCGKMFVSDIPVAIKGYRGFKTPSHDCGEEYVRMTFVPCDPDIKRKWDEALFG